MEIKKRIKTINWYLSEETMINCYKKKQKTIWAKIKHLQNI